MKVLSLPLCKTKLGQRYYARNCLGLNQLVGVMWGCGMAGVLQYVLITRVLERAMLILILVGVVLATECLMSKRT